jgi:threonine dehydrogenase-like Zn-dependent dehydrogenase
MAVWGCGPVGQFAIKSAYLLGAERVLAIDRFPERLRMSPEHGRAEVMNHESEDVQDALHYRTGGRGPDVCIDAVGLEVHGPGLWGLYHRAKTALMLEMDRAFVLRQVIRACRMWGTVSIRGVYGGLIDKVPKGAAFGKRLVFRMGQTHVHRYVRPLLETIRGVKIDPSYVITRRGRLDDAPPTIPHLPRQQGRVYQVRVATLTPWEG